MMTFPDMINGWYLYLYSLFNNYTADVASGCVMH